MLNYGVNLTIEYHLQNNHFRKKIILFNKEKLQDPTKGMLPAANPLKRMRHGQLGHQEDFMFPIPVGQIYPVAYSFERDPIFLPYPATSCYHAYP